MQTKCKLKSLVACRKAYIFAASSKVRGMKLLGLVLALIHYSLIKKLRSMKKTLLVMAVTLMSALQVCAQTTKVTDKDIIGVWVMEWCQFDGEKKMTCGKPMGSTTMKYMGPDGEYACCNIALSNGGKVVVMPHEYGKYTYKDGKYSEMGRPVVRPEQFQLIDKTHFRGRWKNRADGWKKITLPKNVTRYIVDCCKSKNVPADVQTAIKQAMFE